MPKSAKMRGRLWDVMSMRNLGLHLLAKGDEVEAKMWLLRATEGGQ